MGASTAFDKDLLEALFLEDSNIDRCNSDTSFAGKDLNRDTDDKVLIWSCFGEDYGRIFARRRSRRNMLDKRERLGDLCDKCALAGSSKGAVPLFATREKTI